MRARALARDWDYHIWLLQCTLNSILAQSNPEFNVVVVCHDVPEIPQANNPAVHMLRVHHSLPEKTFDDMLVDKVLKLTAGVDWAIARGSDYVMFVDADDLVSRRINEFVASHRGNNGWFFSRGYSHQYGGLWLRKLVRHHLICGTSHVVRLNLLQFARDASYRGERVNTLAAAGHADYCRLLSSQGFPLEPLPFPGAIYVLHSDSACWAPGGSAYHIEGQCAPRPFWRRALSWGKRTAKLVLKLRPLTLSLRTEFTIPKINARHN